MLATWAIIDRDLRKYFRSPALILVSLFLPLLQLVIIGYAFGGKIRDVSVALVDLDRGSEALRLRSKLQAVQSNAGTFRILAYGNAEDATAATRQGRVSAVIVIPEGYTRKVSQGSRPQLGLVLDNTDPFVVSTLQEKMRELLAALNSPQVPLRRPARIALEMVELFPFVEYIEYLLPGAITLAIFLSTLIGGGLLYIDDKARGFHEGYLVTPILKLELVLGLLLAGTMKAAFGGLFVTILGALIAGIASRITWQSFLMLLVMNVLVAFALINMISLMMVRVRDPVVPRAALGILNTLLFFPSGAMYPIYSFPDWLQALARVDPFTYSVHGFRAILLKNVEASAIMGDVAFLSAFSLACFLGVLLFFPRRL